MKFSNAANALIVATLSSWTLESCQALGTDTVRQCQKQTCTGGAGDSQVFLTCGGSGEAITKVLFASLGAPVGSCPGINDDFFEDSEFNVSATTGCDAQKSKQVIEAACLGKEECTVNLVENFALSNPGLESCGFAAVGDANMVVRVECGEVFDFFLVVTALLISVIGLALGASVEIHEFIRIYKEHKRAVFIGFSCQFGIMPILAFTFAKTMDFGDPRVLVGLILVGVCPGGTTSNLLTYYAKGSVALSIVMSACSTLAALFMIPFLTFIYLSKGLGIDDDISIPFGNIVQSLLIAILPAALGVWIRSKNAKIAKKIEIGGTVLGGIFVLGALVLGVIDNPELFVPSKYPNSWVAAIFFQPIGCFFGYCIARLARLPHPECRAICLETGIQNFVLALAIIAISFAGCDRLIINTFPLISTFFYLVNSIWITAFLRFVMARRDSTVEVEQLEKENTELGLQSDL